MRSNLILCTLATLCCLFAGTTPAAGQGFGTGPEGNKYVFTRLVAETRQIAADTEAFIGLNLRISPKWHVYWRYAGDGGGPVSVKWDLPEGVTIGEPLWPAPDRYIQSGVILNYTYEKDVTLLFPVTIDGDRHPDGSALTIKADIEWLVCHEICVFGGRSARLMVSVGSNDEPTEDKALFDTARKTLPLDDDAATRDNVTTSWDGLTLTLKAAGADALEFYPYPVGDDEACLPLSDMIEAGAVKGEAIAIEYDEDARTAPNVRGVLMVTRGDSHAYYAIDVTGPEATP